MALRVRATDRDAVWSSGRADVGGVAPSGGGGIDVHSVGVVSEEVLAEGVEDVLIAHSHQLQKPFAERGVVAATTNKL